MFHRIKRMLPRDPVLSPERSATYSLTPPPAGVEYTGAPRVAFPVLPAQVFGLHYDLDLILVSRHPDWTMHEYARVDFGGESVWLAKDADINGDQSVVADLENIDSWLPEIPVPRHHHRIKVRDASTNGRIDVSMSYDNPKGQPVAFHFTAKDAVRPPSKRNGSTMDHSRGVAAAVLDLTRQGQGGKARMSIDGRWTRIDRLLGLMKMQWVLEQSQGGFAIASFEQRAGADESGFEITRPAPGDAWPTRGQESWETADGWLTRDHAHVLLRYRFSEDADKREWWGAEVRQLGRPEPVITVRLDRALPDLRRPFEGVAESGFVMDVNGQKAHGVGVIRAGWGDDGPWTTMTPTAPWWLAERPMKGTYRFADGRATVRIEREGTAHE